jgi:hypothetical protein
MFNYFNYNYNKEQLAPDVFIFEKYITQSEFSNETIIKNNTYNLNIGHLSNKYLSNVKDQGSYIIMIQNIESNIIQKSYSGVFSLSKAERHFKGVVKKLSESKVSINENIDIEWEPFETPSIILSWTSTDKWYNILSNFKNKDKIRIAFKIRIVGI